MADDGVTIDPAINSDRDDGWFQSLVRMAATDPWQFLYSVLLLLTPLFVISLLLSWRLTKLLENEKKAANRLKKIQKKKTK